jgi:hypothetical protein
MEVDLHKFIWAPCHVCAQLYSLVERPRNSPPPPRIWTRITRALLVRRHLFVTPWFSNFISVICWDRYIGTEAPTLICFSLTYFSLTYFSPDLFLPVLFLIDLFLLGLLLPDLFLPTFLPDLFLPGCFLRYPLLRQRETIRQSI